MNEYYKTKKQDNYGKAMTMTVLMELNDYQKQILNEAINIYNKLKPLSSFFNDKYVQEMYTTWNKNEKKR